MLGKNEVALIFHEDEGAMLDAWILPEGIAEHYMFEFRRKGFFSYFNLPANENRDVFPTFLIIAKPDDACFPHHERFLENRKLRKRALKCIS